MTIFGIAAINFESEFLHNHPKSANLKFITAARKPEAAAYLNEKVLSTKLSLYGSAFRGSNLLTNFQCKVLYLALPEFVRHRCLVPSQLRQIEKLDIILPYLSTGMPHLFLLSLQQTIGGKTTEYLLAAFNPGVGSSEEDPMLLNLT